LPGLPNLLRYETFAVADYDCMSYAPGDGISQAQLAYLPERRDLATGKLDNRST